MAVIFIVLMALGLLLVSMMMNLGQVSKTKTMTANAADAGALAGASMVASGENEVALISQGMALNAIITRFIFLIPWCWDICYKAVLYYAAFVLANRDLADAADTAMKGAWTSAHASALFTAIQNSEIDARGDDLQQIQNYLKTLQEQFQSSNTVPSHVELPEWHHTGADGVPRRRQLIIDTEFAPQPTFKTGGWGPDPWCWSNCWADWGIIRIDNTGQCTSETSCCLCICLQLTWFRICPGCVWPCFPGWGWESSDSKDPKDKVDNAKSSQPTANDGTQQPASQIVSQVIKTAGKAWGALAGIIEPPDFPPTDCKDKWCIPIYLPLSAIDLRTCPGGDMDNEQGEVRVRVTLEQDQEGSQLGFWRMRYPAKTISSAIAVYGGVGIPDSCFGWASPDASAHLKSPEEGGVVDPWNN